MKQYTVCLELNKESYKFIQVAKWKTKGKYEFAVMQEVKISPTDRITRDNKTYQAYDEIRYAYCETKKKGLFFKRLEHYYIRVN
jgi:hypothetical protein